MQLSTAVAASTVSGAVTAETRHIRYPLIASAQESVPPKASIGGLSASPTSSTSSSVSVSESDSGSSSSRDSDDRSSSSASSFCSGCAHRGANLNNATKVTNISPMVGATTEAGATDEIADMGDSDYVPFVKAVNPAVYRRFIEQKYFSNVGRVHKEREERQARLEAEMALMGLSEASRAHMRKMLQTKESNYMRMQRARMDESMFVRIKRLGRLLQILLCGLHQA